MGWRKLFGMESPVETVPDPSPAPQDTTARFAIDRSRMFDLGLTGRLYDLFEVPRERRDPAWTAAFFTAVWNASLEIPDQPFFEGPDGFPYFRFQLPRPATPFDSNALANQAQLLVDRGCGAAIFTSPDATEPDYVLPMGVIDSLLRFDNWDGDPLDRPDRTDSPDPVYVADGTEPGKMVATRDHQLLIGTPSPAMLPPYTARALYHHLTRGWGIANPRVALLVDPNAEAPRSLMIDRRPEDFPDPDLMEPQVNMLLWYLPPHSAVMLRPDAVDLDEMTPLDTLFPANGAEGSA